MFELCIVLTFLSPKNDYNNKYKFPKIFESRYLSFICVKDSIQIVTIYSIVWYKLDDPGNI